MLSSLAMGLTSTSVVDLGDASHMPIELGGLPPTVVGLLVIAVAGTVLWYGEYLSSDAKYSAAAMGSGANGKTSQW